MKTLPNSIIYAERDRVRTATIERDENCVYCGVPITIYSGSMDHLTPECLGGETSLDNCAGSCVRCNKEKSSDLPLEFIARRAGFAIPQDLRSRLRPGETLSDVCNRLPRPVRKTLQSLADNKIVLDVDNGIKGVRMRRGQNHYLDTKVFNDLLARGFIELECEAKLGGMKRQRVYRITSLGRNAA